MVSAILERKTGIRDEILRKEKKLEKCKMEDSSEFEDDTDYYAFLNLSKEVMFEI